MTTVEEAFKIKLKNDMLYYENLLRQSVDQNNFDLSENIKIILSVIYRQISNENKK